MKIFFLAVILFSQFSLAAPIKGRLDMAIMKLFEEETYEVFMDFGSEENKQKFSKFIRTNGDYCIGRLYQDLPVLLTDPYFQSEFGQLADATDLLGGYQDQRFLDRFLPYRKISDDFDLGGAIAAPSSNEWLEQGGGLVNIRVQAKQLAKNSRVAEVTDISIQGMMANWVIFMHKTNYDSSLCDLRGVLEQAIGAWKAVLARKRMGSRIYNVLKIERKP